MKRTDALLGRDRSQCIKELHEVDHVHVVIIGGGIHGAVMARQLSGQGITVALFEKGDYASGTSSRSSKMAHGGLRYLEMFDFEQVFEGIKAREELFEQLPNLVHPYPFLIPVNHGDYWFRSKLKVGLFLYDMMVKHRERRHSWITRKKLSFTGFSSDREDLMGCFQYYDGLLNDARLVIENILAARLQGALCLNYMPVQHLQFHDDNRAELHAVDALTGNDYSLTADCVVNCAGPFVNQFLDEEISQPDIRFSRGTHLLFSVPWNDPALFLPMEGDSRYYFVWPHETGTMVGTTEREVTAPSKDPQPSQSEVHEILLRLSVDLPDSGLDRHSLHYAFAGERTLPIREEEENTGTISRKHIWHRYKNVFSLYGGKLTTSEWTIEEGARLVLNHLGKETYTKDALRLPGGLVRENVRLRIQKEGAEAGLSDGYVHQLINRYGEEAQQILDAAQELDQQLLSDREVDYSITVEQAVHIEDILRRRTALEFYPTHGLDTIPLLKEKLGHFFPDRDVDGEEQAYKDRICALHETFQTD